MFKSSSKWEDSYFGGFVKILQDYPEIRAPFSIDWEVPNELKHKLSYYCRDKLFSLFQMKIAEYNLLDDFLTGAEVIPKTNWIGEQVGWYLVSQPAAILAVNKRVMVFDSELASLFEHYADLIGKTIFKYPYNPSQPPPPPSSGEEKGDKKGKDDEESEDEEQEGERDFSKDEIDVSEAKKQAAILVYAISKAKLFKWNECVTSGELKTTCKFRMMKKDLVPCQYNTDEIISAAQLSRMLDISFDPCRDKVPNLRNGKLDVEKLGSMPAGNHHIYYKIEEDQTTKPFSVCILGDESGSMNGGYYENDGRTMKTMAYMQHKVMKILYKTFSEILPPNKMFIYGHSGSHYPEIRVYHDNLHPDFEYTIGNQMKNSFSQNYDGPVIERVYEKVREATSDNIIFISISDGSPAGHDYGGLAAITDMKRIIEKCKRDGFVTAGIGIHYGGVRGIYSYSTVITEVLKMPHQVSMLVNQMVKAEFQS